jgi:ribonuclease P protein component
LKQSLGKRDRIKGRKELDRVFRRGRAASNGLMAVHAAANSLGRPRMAVAVSPRHGNAVRRNRIKRLCREAFRVCRQDLPCGYDYVLRPKAGVELSVGAVRDSLRKLAGRLAGGPKR